MERSLRGLSNQNNPNEIDINDTTTVTHLTSSSLGRSQKQQVLREVDLVKEEEANSVNKQTDLVKKLGAYKIEFGIGVSYKFVSTKK